jgi:hypothetical protein
MKTPSYYINREGRAGQYRPGGIGVSAKTIATRTVSVIINRKMKFTDEQLKEAIKNNIFSPEQVDAFKTLDLFKNPVGSRTSPAKCSAFCHFKRLLFRN